MKIKYKFANDEETEIEVSDEIGAVVMESRRKEHADNERHRYHGFSSDLVSPESGLFSDGTVDPAEMLIKRNDDEELRSHLEEGLSQLTEKERRRLLMYAEGLTFHKIAEIEGVSSHSKIIKSVNRAKEKMKKFLENFQKG